MPKKKRKQYGKYATAEVYVYGNLQLTGDEMNSLDREAKANGRKIRSEINMLVKAYCKKLKKKHEGTYQ